jgi:hypothetical protein
MFIGLNRLKTECGNSFLISTSGKQPHLTCGPPSCLLTRSLTIPHSKVLICHEIVLDELFGMEESVESEADEQ